MNQSRDGIISPARVEPGERRFGVAQRFGQRRQLLGGEPGRKRIGDEGLDRFTGDGCGDVTTCGLQIHGNGFFTMRLISKALFTRV